MIRENCINEFSVCFVEFGYLKAANYDTHGVLLSYFFHIFI